MQFGPLAVHRYNLSCGFFLGPLGIQSSWSTVEGLFSEKPTVALFQDCRVREDTMAKLKQQLSENFPCYYNFVTTQQRVKEVLPTSWQSSDHFDHANRSATKTMFKRRSHSELGTAESVRLRLEAADPPSGVSGQQRLGNL